MADEQAELVGGISVSVGASHSRLAADLAEADRILEAWAKQRFTVHLGAQVQAGAAPAPRPQPAPPISFGPGSSTRAQSQQAQTALQRAINAELSKTGEIFNAQTGEIESATKAYQAQRQVVASIREEASQPTAIAIDTKPLQDDLQAVLATMREIVAEAQKVASTPVSRASGGASRGRSATQRAAAARLDALGSSAGVAYTGVPSVTNIRAPGYRTDEEIERQRQGSNRSVAPALPGGGQGFNRERAQREAFDQAQAQATAQAFAQSRRVRQFQIDEEQQARIVNARRAAITGSGRTSRTLASGLGALFGGTEQRQIEAQVAASQAARALSSAERAIEPLDNRLRDLARSWSTATGQNRAFNREQFLAIRRSDEYRAALGNVKDAISDDADAQDRLNKISSGTSVVRNLVAITAAGAAFGAGLRIASVATDAIVSSVGNLVDIQTGFGATSTRVTSALGQQTLALHGNVQEALAAAEAQAGLSAAAADAVNKQLTLTTQIKAGAQAQQQASELFRAAAGAGNAPSGLFGGYGGIGGTSFLAQQLGGGRGFTETIQQDLAAFGRPGGPDFLGDINRGLQYVNPLDSGVRDLINQAADQQGNPLGTIGRIPGGIGDVISSLNPLGRNFGKPYQSSNGPQDQQTAENAPTLNEQGVAYLKNLNDEAGRGATALGSASRATVKFTNDANEIAAAVRAAAQAGDAYGVQLAQQQHIVVQLGDAVADSGDKYRQAIEQFATGAGITDPAVLARQSLAAERQRQREAAASLDTIRAQQAYERPAAIAALSRQTQYAIGTQLPAQAALSQLANPNAPVGTGIAPEDQRKLASGLKEAQGLQQQLNDYYAQGQDIIENTYRPAILQNFGQAAAHAFDQALGAVEATGKQIASIQAGISNEQAAYQVAQYNFQLQIAKRNLSDIGGLTDHNFGAGESYLGVLERQNLALSRQGQLLQFQLSQRQINFQTALAGFQAPGVTPEERQARIAEAKIEADFAQKQLDIQKQIFGNQVQIVDISNLRQGADLAKQIGLLLQGRRVTLDTSAAEQKLLRLQQIQQHNVAAVSSYLSAVDNLAAKAFGNIQQLETAAGHAMASVARDVLAQFGIVLNGLSGELNALNSGTSGGGGGGRPPLTHASGGVFQTNGMTRLGAHDIVGEAGGEVVAILAHPRTTSGYGGGTNVVVQFTGDIHTSNTSDLDRITQAVVKALGRQASLVGLRGVG